MRRETSKDRPSRPPRAAVAAAPDQEPGSDGHISADTAADAHADAHADPGPARLRIDKWLWQARFFKSRSLAAAVATSGHLRINGQPISRASREVGPGDVLTFPQGRLIRLVRILRTGVRRGPASEAQSLFIDLDAPSAPPVWLE